MKSLHKLLAARLERHYGDLASVPPDLAELLYEIDATLRESTQRQQRLEQALEASSQELIRATEEMSSEKELLTVTLHSIGEGVITTDTEGHITLINRVAQELTGWPQEEALGTPAKIYYKDESVSPAGSHKPNTAIPQAWYNRQAGTKTLTTETGVGRHGETLRSDGT